MKTKNPVIMSIAVIVLFGGLSFITNAAESNAGVQDVNALKAKIGEMEKIIKTQAEQIRQIEKQLGDLRKQLDAQIKENNSLRGFEQKEDVGTAKKGVASDSISAGRIFYLGKERDEKWFNRMYARFYDKIAMAYDKYIDIRTFTFKPSYSVAGGCLIGDIVETTEKEGDKWYYKNYYYATLVVIRDREALINCRIEAGSRTQSDKEWNKGRSNFVFHLCGYDKPLIEGKSLDIPRYLICVGVYEYTTTVGDKRKVTSFKPWEPKPLTREEFAEALRIGFELVDYIERQGKIIEVPIR